MNALETGLAKDELEEMASIIMSLQRCFTVRLSEQLAKGQISFPQYFLLGHIEENGSLSMSSIAEKMNHTTAAATGLVDRLENLGYVERAHDTSDRRKVFVKITPKGSQLAECIRQEMVDNLDTIRQELTPDEQKVWLNIYRKIHIYCQKKRQAELVSDHSSN